MSNQSFNIKKKKNNWKLKIRKSIYFRNNNNELSPHQVQNIDFLMIPNKKEQKSFSIGLKLKKKKLEDFNRLHSKRFI